jgi:hypothetical protein
MRVLENPGSLVREDKAIPVGKKRCVAGLLSVPPEPFSHAVNVFGI